MSTNTVKKPCFCDNNLPSCLITSRRSSQHLMEGFAIIILVFNFLFAGNRCAKVSKFFVHLWLQWWMLLTDNSFEKCPQAYCAPRSRTFSISFCHCTFHTNIFLKSLTILITICTAWWWIPSIICNFILRNALLKLLNCLPHSAVDSG